LTEITGGGGSRKKGKRPGKGTIDDRGKRNPEKVDRGEKEVSGQKGRNRLYKTGWEPTSRFYWRERRMMTKGGRKLGLKRKYRRASFRLPESGVS